MQLFKKRALGALACITTFVVGGFFNPSSGVPEERPFRSHDDSLDHQGTQPERDGDAEARPRVPGNYGKYRKDFAELCAALEADGRREFIYTVMLGISAEDPTCLDCESFFKIFLPPCKPKQSRLRSANTRAKGTPEEQPEMLPSPVPTPLPARLPGMRVHTKLTEIAVKLAEDESKNIETLQVVDKIAAALGKREGRTHGEQEYAEAFADFISTPFSGVRAKISAELKSSSSNRPDDALDEPRGTEGLFDY